MDMQSQMTRPYGHDQAEDPIRVHHPEEEEHQEKGATKVFKKVKEKAKKIKNSLTKHGQGHDHDHDVDEEDDEYDEHDQELHGAPVYESSAVRGGVTGQPESLSHPGEANVPAPEEIIPPGTKVFPVVSSDYTKPAEPEPLRDTSYGHEAASHLTDISERDEKREAPSHPLRVFDMAEREESREAHHMPMNTPVSLLSATEDVTRTFAPGEDEYLGGQRKVNIERPKGLEEDPAAPGGGSSYLSGVSNYQSKVTDPTHEGGGESGVPGIVESLGRMKVTDESPNRKSGREFERDLPIRNNEFGLKNESGIQKDSPAGFGGESGVPGFVESRGRMKVTDESPNQKSGREFERDLPIRNNEFGLKNESGIQKDSLAGFGGESGVPWFVESRGRMKVTDKSPNQKSGREFERDLPIRNNEFGLKNESGIQKDSPAGFGGESGAGIRKDIPTRSHEFNQKNDSGIDKNSPTVLAIGSIAGLGEDFPARNHELGVKTDTGTGNDSAKGSHRHGEDTGAGVEKKIPVRSDDVKVGTGLGRDLPTGTHDQFSPELSRPKERDDFDSKSEDTNESKPSTYTEKIGSATSFVTDKAIAAKNAVASKLGYSGQSGGGGGQHQSSVGDETTPRSATGYGQKVAGTVAEKLTPVYEKVKETGSTVMTKLPLSGGGSGAEEKQQVEDKSVSTRDYLAEKLRPGEEDKALSEVIAEKLHLGGGEKKTTTRKKVEVTVEKIPSDLILEEKEHGEAVLAEEGKVGGGGAGGMVGKLKGAVTSWLGGATEEVKPKSSDSLDESSQSLGSTVGTMGFSDSGGALSGQRGLQDSGN